ncbi:MAG: hypothetical protein V4608_12580 [Bacteroidota bacterium]
MKHEPLTPEKLRRYKGFENVSDEKAVEDIHFIETFANILFEIYQNDEKLECSDTKQISLDTNIINK